MGNSIVLQAEGLCFHGPVRVISSTEISDHYRLINDLFIKYNEMFSSKICTHVM